ncbi:putative poly(A)-specific ribonuclease [Helianthus debilis subsp. tardiflorus]
MRSVDDRRLPVVSSMLNKPSSSHFLHTATAAAAAAAMSIRPSSSYRGGRNQWRSRGYSNRPPYSPRPDNHNNDATTDYNPHPPPHFNSRPAPFSHYHPPYTNPFYYQNPHFQPPPPLYNQQQFRPPPQRHDYRNWEQAKPGPPPTCERFRVLSYNILADYLAINHRTKLYFHIPRHILHWEYRFSKILFELGLWSADILCLQVVDRFQDLEQNLKLRGYTGIWKMRTGEPVDGCAIFWRSSRFKLLQEEAIEFNKFGLRDNVAQICVLESLSEKSSAGSHPPASSEGRNKVVICNIHVLFNPKRGEIKLGQVRILLERAYATSKLWDDAPVVLCGDFNSTPKSSLYNFISEQKLNVSELPRDKISGQYSAEIYPKRPVFSNFRSQSIDNATQSPTSVDNNGELSSSLPTNTTLTEDEKTPKEESEGSSVNCTSEITENISSGVITDDNNPDGLLKAIEDLSIGEDSTPFLSGLHGPDGSVAEDGNDVADSEPFVENQNPCYDPSGWTPMEIKAATGSSECMTMEHHLKLRSTYTEVEDYSGTRDSYGEPQVTSYHRGFQGTLDYIWRSEGLQTVRVLAPIPKKAMEWTPGFPTKKWGSDHVALVAELAFNKVADEEKSQIQ